MQLHRNLKKQDSKFILKTLNCNIYRKRCLNLLIERLTCIKMRDTRFLQLGLKQKSLNQAEAGYKCF